MESRISKQEVTEFIANKKGYELAYNNTDLPFLFGVIDLTTLKPSDNPRSVNNFVHNGLNMAKDNNLPNVAAVCVFSNFTELVKHQLKDTGIKTAVVAGAFPHGQSHLDARANEVRLAALAGADEIDVVINRGILLSGEYQELAIELYTLRQMAGNAKLKFILEVCDLSLTQVYKASVLAMQAGADFIKTSTGKGSHGATLEAALVMCRAIAQYHEKTGTKVGFKAAGGISTVAQAMPYIRLVKDILGADWLRPELFRIGASSLATDVIANYLGQNE